MIEITNAEHDDLKELALDQRTSAKAFAAAQTNYANQCNLLAKRAAKIWSSLRIKYNLDINKTYQVKGKVIEERLADPLCRESEV